MLYLAILLFVVSIFLLMISTRQREATGLPGGQIIYSDTSKWDQVDKPLYDKSLDLAGKPDYIIRKGNEIIPVEVKSTRIYQSPYDSHIYQLAAYCRLVQAEYKKRPSHGILHYRNQTFKIEYTKELEENLLDMLIEMRSQKYKRAIHRSHESQQRCARCGYRSMCDESIA